MPDDGRAREIAVPVDAEAPVIARRVEVPPVEVLGVPDEVKGNEVVCFCVLRPGHAPSEALREALKAKVAEGLGKPLQPREIKFVKDLPKTRNAKVMRRIIRAAYLGLDPGDTSSLENPAAVEEIRQAA